MCMWMIRENMCHSQFYYKERPARSKRNGRENWRQYQKIQYDVFPAWWSTFAGSALFFIVFPINICPRFEYARTYFTGADIGSSHCPRSNPGFVARRIFKQPKRSKRFHFSNMRLPAPASPARRFFLFYCAHRLLCAYALHLGLRKETLRLLR